jgi:hypothetical protein
MEINESALKKMLYQNESVLKTLRARASTSQTTCAVSLYRRIFLETARYDGASYYLTIMFSPKNPMETLCWTTIQEAHPRRTFLQ